VVVVAIIGELIDIVGAYACRQLEKAKIDETKMIIGRVEKAMNYHQPCCCCPKSLSELVSEKLLAKEPVDAWGQPLIFKCPAEHSTVYGVDIVSKGKDKQEGTADDIKNWEL
jgi:hypothetical protein